jgi:hypothetical protein
MDNVTVVKAHIFLVAMVSAYLSDYRKVYKTFTVYNC